MVADVAARRDDLEPANDRKRSSRERYAWLQTTVSNNFPIPAVSAIASAPQNVTRAVARRTFAPPALAPIAPSSEREPNDAAETIGTSAPAGETMTMSR